MLPAGTLLGNYKILRQLGSGGMADVYEAEDQTLGRRVALKVLPPEFGRNPQLVARFEKEVRSSASLNHAGIVTVFEVGRAEGVHYYSMRLLTGGDLRGRIEQGLNDIQALAILREITDAFVHAHAAGFVHRDVKPENILFDEQGRAVLTDFGIAKVMSSESKMTATGVSIGTPRYISPEQARGKAVDARADLYSLGCILYEMLTGEPPFDAEESLALIFKHVTEPIPRLPEALAKYQPLVDSLMAKEPAQRPASSIDLLRLIDELLPIQRTGALPQYVTGAFGSLPTASGVAAGRGTGNSLPTVVTGERGDLERLEREKQEKDRAEQQRREQEAAEREREEQARREQEAAERQRADQQRREQQEQERRAADEARRRAEEEATRKRAAEEAAARERAQAERQRQEELAKQRAEEEARRRAAAEQAQRERAEAERQRKEEEARRKAEEAERKRQQAEADRLRREEEARIKAEQAAVRKAEKERAAREAAERKQAEAAVARERREEQARLKKEENERKQAEKEAERQRRAAQKQQAQAEAAARKREAETRGESTPGKRSGLLIAGAAVVLGLVLLLWWLLRSPEPAQQPLSSATPGPTPTADVTPAPTAAIRSPEPSPTIRPTATPEPTVVPTAPPTLAPTFAPTSPPSPDPTATATATASPTATPTATPDPRAAEAARKAEEERLRREADERARREREAGEAEATRRAQAEAARRAAEEEARRQQEEDARILRDAEEAATAAQRQREAEAAAEKAKEEEKKPDERLRRPFGF